MPRTVKLKLTDEQGLLLGARAARAGVSVADLLRAGLGVGPGPDLVVHEGSGSSACGVPLRPGHTASRDPLLWNCPLCAWERHTPRPAPSAPACSGCGGVGTTGVGLCDRCYNKAQEPPPPPDPVGEVFEYEPREASEPPPPADGLDDWPEDMASLVTTRRPTGARRSRAR